jgi:hypothetical protein
MGSTSEPHIQNAINEFAITIVTVAEKKFGTSVICDTKAPQYMTMVCTYIYIIGKGKSKKRPNANN